jgi:hypothetical protein
MGLCTKSHGLLRERPYRRLGSCSAAPETHFSCSFLALVWAAEVSFIVVQSPFASGMPTPTLHPPLCGCDRYTNLVSLPTGSNPLRLVDSTVLRVEHLVEAMIDQAQSV